MITNNAAKMSEPKRNIAIALSSVGFSGPTFSTSQIPNKKPSVVPKNQPRGYRSCTSRKSKLSSSRTIESLLKWPSKYSSAFP